MSNQITPNPSVPSQVVQEVKFPQFVNNLGIIPTSYKDSMSYYECLAWLCKYLEETVIPSVNENGDAVEELQGLYIQLNNYVDNYFDTLDVQEEINNKLDEMASSGTLQPIVANIFSSLQQQINSVASGSPAGTYSTVSDLTTADPDHSKIYVVTQNGNWYYYNTSTSQWTSGGLYQAVRVDDNSIGNSNIIDSSIFREKLNVYTDIIENATSVVRNKKITAFNVTTYEPVLGNSDNYDVYYFSSATIQNKILTIPINRSDSTYQAIIAYTSNSGQYNITNKANTSGYAVLDSSNNFMNYIIMPTFANIAVTLPKNFEVVMLRDNVENINYENNYPYYSKISGKNILGKIPYNHIDTNIIDLEKEDCVSIMHNVRFYGYNQTTYLPSYNTDKNYSVILLDLDLIDDDYLLSLYFKLANISSGNVLYAYHNNPASVGQLWSVANLVSLDAINTTTHIVNLTKVLNTVESRHYNKIALTIDNTSTTDFVIYSQKSNVEKNLSVNNYEVVIPSKFKVVNNMQLPFFYQNMIKGINTNFANDIRIHNDPDVKNFKNVALHKSTTNGTKNVFFQGYLEQLNHIDFSKSIYIETLAANSGSGTKKVLLIGDSLTDIDVYPQKLYELFENDSMSIELLGTRGTSPYLEEGRSAWRAYTYVNCESGSDDPLIGSGFSGINPFYNIATQTFDFSYYMQQQEYDSVDYVFINLGTNDIGRSPNTESDIISYYNTMIESIHDYDENIKIGLWLNPCRGIKDNYNYLPASGNGKDLALKMIQYLIKNYSNMESDNIYLIPVYSAVDPDNDYNTETVTIGDTNYTNITDYIHPKASGYQKIANVLYYWIKYFGSLD